MADVRPIRLQRVGDNALHLSVRRQHACRYGQKFPSPFPRLDWLYRGFLPFFD
jgi:hypothetical protein